MSKTENNILKMFIHRHRMAATWQQRSCSQRNLPSSMTLGSRT